MSLFLKSNKQKILLILFVLTLIPFIARIQEPHAEINALNEKYDPKLRSLSSLDKLISYADDTYKKANPNSGFDSSKYIRNLSRIMKDRFYHGDLKYTFSENWIAWACGKFLWSHMSFIVLTDDILKHSMAICSQQTGVFIEALRKKGLRVRSIALGFDEGPGHYLCEVWYGGSWHLHDVSIEPNWGKIQNDHLSLNDYLSQKDTLYKAYEGRMPKAIFYKILERHVYGKTNDLPAKHMKLFQWTAKVLTYLFPVLFGFLFILTLFQNKKSDRHEAPFIDIPSLSGDKFMKEKINS